MLINAGDDWGFSDTVEVRDEGTGDVFLETLFQALTLACHQKEHEHIVTNSQENGAALVVLRRLPSE